MSVQASVIASQLREAGAIVSPKSTLEAVTGLAWTGKSFDFRNATMCTAGVNWHPLVARWWQVGVRPCVRHQLLCFLGMLLWFVRPVWGVLPFVAPVWAHILWQPQCLDEAPVRLVDTLADLLPWDLMVLKPLVFFKETTRLGGVYIFLRCV